VDIEYSRDKANELFGSFQFLFCFETVDPTLQTIDSSCFSSHEKIWLDISSFRKPTPLLEGRPRDCRQTFQAAAARLQCRSTAANTHRACAGDESPFHQQHVFHRSSKSSPSRAYVLKLFSDSDYRRDRTGSDIQESSRRPTTDGQRRPFRGGSSLVACIYQLPKSSRF
jgi:hypothetical protein